MAGFKNAKDLVRDYYAQIDADPLKASKYCAPNALWRGYHPFNEISDPNEVAERFWDPLKTIFDQNAKTHGSFYGR
jgi:hypothetical protein